MTRRIDMYMECKTCKRSFKTCPSLIRQGRKCCSASCSRKFVWSKPGYREHMSNVHKGYIPSNIEFIVERNKSSENRARMSVMGKKIGGWNKGILMPSISGENSPHWISDRTKLAKRQVRNDMAYKEWRKQVWLRDKFTCKIANQNCLGRIEAHHILGWTSHPELRYHVNNGITLCHAHHPRKRAEEKRLAPDFQKLVSVSNLK